MAARDNRIAAESIGIDIAKTKMMAFVISSALAGAAGALYGLNYSSLVAYKFDYNTSIMILVYVVLGGLGNMNYATSTMQAPKYAQPGKPGQERMVTLDGKEFYFSASHERVDGLVSIDNKPYYFDPAAGKQKNKSLFRHK